MKELSPVTPFKGPNDESGATPGHADEFNQRQNELMKRDEEIRAVLSSQDQQTAKLTHGQNIVEADQSSVADVLIEGRTMVNLLGDGKIKPSTDGQQTSETFTRREGIASAGVAQVRENGKYGKYSQWLRADTPIFSITKMYSKNDFLRRFPVGSKLAIRIDARGSSSRTLSFGGVGYFRTDSFATKSIWNQSNEYEPIVLLVNVPDEDYKNYHISIEPRHSGAEMEVDGFAIYSITDDEYIKGLSMTNKQLGIQYPYIDGVQHVKNPVITKKGKNLLPPFYKWELHESTKVDGPYKIKTLSSTPSNNATSVIIPALPNTTYTFSYSGSERARGRVFSNSANNNLALTDLMYAGSHSTETFVTRPDTYRLIVFQDVGSQETGEFVFENPILTIGEHSVFEPQNEGFLYTQAKLGSSLDGTVRDLIYKKDNDYVHQKWLKRLRLDGSTLNFKANRFEGSEGFVEIYTDEIRDNKPFSQNGKHFLIDSNNYLYPQKSNTGEAADIKKSFVLGGAGFWIRIPNTETGWTSLPSNNQVREYLKDNEFELQYELAKSLEHTLTFEGSIDMHSGKNLLEVDSGVIVREKANPQVSQNGELIQINTIAHGESKTKYRAARMLAVYKDGYLDREWSYMIRPTTANIELLGYGYANLPIDKYDPEAEYTVTYLVQDKHKFTTNVDKASVTYQTSLKSAHDATVKQTTDNTSDISAINLLMGEVVKSLRILGGE
ncbi:hypothetical protein [Shouchella miscanthi]|uniref:hypothetical protein n=1 Tax=Shouchella miscanthi TaxID=2598861 RepID=UPI0011A63460|nr:hypothetical protein [Shouchella miscanthi]